MMHSGTSHRLENVCSLVGIPTPTVMLMGYKMRAHYCTVLYTTYGYIHFLPVMPAQREVKFRQACPYYGRVQYCDDGDTQYCTDFKWTHL